MIIMRICPAIILCICNITYWIYLSEFDYVNHEYARSMSKVVFERLRQIKAFPDVLNGLSCSCKHCLFCVHRLVVVECRCGLWKYIHNICVNVIPGGTEVIFQCGHQAPREGILHRGDRTPTREMFGMNFWFLILPQFGFLSPLVWGYLWRLNMRCLFEEARKT